MSVLDHDALIKMSLINLSEEIWVLDPNVLIRIYLSTKEYVLINSYTMEEIYKQTKLTGFFFADSKYRHNIHIMTKKYDDIRYLRAFWFKGDIHLLDDILLFIKSGTFAICFENQSLWHLFDVQKLSLRRLEDMYKISEKWQYCRLGFHIPKTVYQTRKWSFCDDYSFYSCIHLQIPFQQFFKLQYINTFHYTFKKYHAHQLKNTIKITCICQHPVILKIKLPAYHHAIGINTNQSYVQNNENKLSIISHFNKVETKPCDRINHVKMSSNITAIGTHEYIISLQDKYQLVEIQYKHETKTSTNHNISLVTRVVDSISVLPFVLSIVMKQKAWIPWIFIAFTRRYFCHLLDMNIFRLMILYLKQ
jgi:hypothetical protein